MPTDETVLKLRTLLVEDEPLILEWLEELLRELGCSIAGAASTLAQALQTFDGVDADVAILDVHLGNASVFPVAESLRARGIPIIFTSGAGGEALPPSWQSCRILGKPFNQQQLAAALRTIAKLPSNS
jgi:DNA-binding response OmpR family regulator